MFSWLSNAWRVPELRCRLLFTAGVLAVYRLGSWVPAPGVDQKALAQFFGHGGGSGGVLQLLNLFSGSALSRFSLFALDRKSTRLNSSHSQISYAVFCLKKKNFNARSLYRPKSDTDYMRLH